MALNFLDRLLNPSLGGLSNRRDVAVVDSVSTSLPLNVSSLVVDGISLSGGNRILYVNLSNPNQNNRVYVVSQSHGTINVTLTTDGKNPDGSAANGEVVQVESGVEWEETIWGFQFPSYVRTDFENLTADAVIIGKALTGFIVGADTPILPTDSILEAFEKTQAQIAAAGGAPTIPVWGNIIGLLSNQTDLQSALNLKANISSLSTVATTGLYLSLIGAPTDLAYFTNSPGYINAISINSLNGLAGTSSGGSTPTITLSTTVSGLLKGNGTAISAAIAGTDYVLPSGSITGTASNITAIVNSTLIALPSLSVSGTQVSGDIPDNAANINATSNSTLTSLPFLVLPGTQVSGNIAGTASDITATSNSSLITLPNLNLPSNQVTGNIPGSQIFGNIAGSAGNIVATFNSTLTNLTSLVSAPNLVVAGSQVSGNILGNSAGFTGALSGNVTGTQGATFISAPTVTGKLLTGYIVGTNTPIVATDSILQAFQKIQGQLNNTDASAITGLIGDVTATGPGSVTATLTATSNATLVTLSSLALPAPQLTGILQGAQFPALTGDVTSVAGSLNTTLTATSNSTLISLPNLVISNSQVTNLQPLMGAWAALGGM